MKVKLTRSLGRNLADALNRDVKELREGVEITVSRPDGEMLVKRDLATDITPDEDKPKPADIKAVPPAKTESPTIAGENKPKTADSDTAKNKRGR